MIESEHRTPADEPDLGPPILLKRLGNAVEANLAKAKLATAGIPSFLGGENVFAGDLVHPLPFHEVELYVPESMVNDALDVLEAPPVEEMDFEPYVEDPGRALSFRAFVAAVVGWLAFFLAPIGFLLAVVPFVFAIRLASRGLMESIDRPRSITAKCFAALALSILGLLAVIGVSIEIYRNR